MGDEPAFEDMYRAAGADLERIPWARGEARPEFVDWLDEADLPAGSRALVVACGTGDDAEHLAARGYDVDAFDVAPTAIELCHARFPDSVVRYRVADVLALPGDWAQVFDLVVEIHTLQSIPSSQRRDAAVEIAATVAPGGRLFVRALARDPDVPPDSRPWPLTRDELAVFADEGLAVVEFTDEPADGETPRRVQLVARRPGSPGLA